MNARSSAVATVLSNWHNVMRAINMASSQSCSNYCKILNAKQNNSESSQRRCGPDAGHRPRFTDAVAPNIGQDTSRGAGSGVARPDCRKDDRLKPLPKTLRHSIAGKLLWMSARNTKTGFIVRYPTALTVSRQYHLQRPSRGSCLGASKVDASTTQE